MLARMTTIPVSYIASAVAIAAVVALAVAHELSPALEPAVTVRAEQFPVAPKGDAVEPPESHAVRTIPIVPAPIDAQAAISAAVVVLPPAPIIPQIIPPHRISPAKPTDGDICAHHGGHRVDDAAGRSWHCVYPKRGR